MKKTFISALVFSAALGNWPASLLAADTAVLGSMTVQKTLDSQTPLHRQATTEAWAAFKAGDHALAIARADECIDRFSPSANGIQALLEKENARLPTGKVSAEERERIGQYQILHDVAACLMIKAWSEEQLGKTEAAITTCSKVMKYTFARVSESNGDPIWSPSERAAQQLKKLSK